jgi:nitrate reductase assembly molybdenum cofactor insertion protein NarJ
MSKKETIPKQVMLKTVVAAEFVYPDEATTIEQIEHRKILQMVTDKAAERLQPIFRAILTEILDAQSRHYVHPIKEKTE